VCHPHPDFGGSRHSSLIVALCESLAGLGVAALRFDTSGPGPGALEETAAALDALAAHLPGLPLGIAGYSFGANLAAWTAAGDGRVRAAALVAPGATGGRPLPPAAEVPGLVVVAAGDDTVFPLSGLRAWLGDAPRTALVVLEGADHLFAGRTPEAGLAAATALAARL
jgi:hypothetical protein